ncbi:MAG TPA: hypothetical protein VFQ40_08505 [Actinomycetota bacterium]|nr:hypothetical protein [Actinomycetota bacterium]
MLERYRVERPDDTLGKPQTLAKALQIIEARLQNAPDAEVLRVKKVLYEIPPEAPPNFDADAKNYTASALAGYRKTLERFPQIGWAGGFFCKQTDRGGVSQHAIRSRVAASAGNAVDWTAPQKVENEGAEALIKWLWNYFEWAIRETTAGRRKTAELIFRDVKWTPAKGRFRYTGTFHWSHVHESFSPMGSTSAECVTS